MHEVFQSDTLRAGSIVRAGVDTGTRPGRNRLAVGTQLAGNGETLLGTVRTAHFCGRRTVDVTALPGVAESFEYKRIIGAVRGTVRAHQT